MRADLQTIGFAQSLPRYVAASATRFSSGEPLIQAAVTWTAGVADANTFTAPAIDILVVGTDVFGGISTEEAEPKNSTDTLVAQKVTTSNPVPYLGRIRGVGTTKASIDTDAELLLLIQDMILITYNATGAADGGPLFTMAVAPAADTSGFQLQDGNPATGTLDVTVDGECYRFERTT